MKANVLKTISPAEIKSFVQIGVLLAQTGGEVLQQFWGNLSDVRDKEVAGDIVTEADKESERRIIELLHQKCPSHSILAEESGKSAKADADFLWVIDPLDGTINYAHQFPLVSVSVALLYCGNPLVGVVYNPFYQELYQSGKGLGATLNGKPLHVSSTKKLSKSLLATGFPYDRRQNPDNNYPEFCHLTDQTLGVRRGGSAALDLAFVAAGRCDGYWERGIQPWDVAAGALLVLEAGGKVTGYDGSPCDLFSGRLLATNGHIHQELSGELMKLSRKVKS